MADQPPIGGVSRLRSLAQDVSMAVAVNSPPDVTATPPHLRLAAASLAGAAYVLGSTALVLFGVPRLWESAVAPALVGLFGEAAFINVGLRVIAMLAVAFGLYGLGNALAGAHPPRGLRAGISVTIALAMTVLFLSIALADNLLLRLLKIEAQQTGLLAYGAIVAVLVGVVGWIYRKPSFGQFLVALEEQGWFEARSYKRTQGLRMRRFTMAGMLIIAFSGVYTLWSSNVLVGGGSLSVRIPYSDTYLTLLPNLQYSLPLLLAAGSLWLSWRAVNMPAFADFLIATDAEMNKVSWSPWDKLIRDTIVVLVTVLLLTIFLFTVDVIFGQVFRWGGIVPAPKSRSAATQELDW